MEHYSSDEADAKLIDQKVGEAIDIALRNQRPGMDITVSVAITDGNSGEFSIVNQKPNTPEGE